jgi:hypothetical protein
VTTTKRNYVPTEETVLIALFVLEYLRNSLEKFHVKYLSDAAMRELNPIIRNAVLSAIHVFLLRKQSPSAKTT